MQSYYYHLKFELYATPDPTTNSARDQDHLSDSGADIWLPRAGANIFDELPSHPKRSRDVRRSTSGVSVEGQHASHPRGGAGTTVIDCGASRAAGAGSAEGREEDRAEGDVGKRRSNLAFHSEKQWRARAKSSPPPGFKAGIGPRTAGKDWRFGRVRIESFDRVGGGVMAGEGSAQQPVPAASLGPNLGGMGQATKGRYMPLETKNTEAGWGIVHLYREADESSALEALPESGEEADGVASGSGGGGGEDGGTILCIPAVPSYLSPGDFLGFIGEKWRGDVSHYRMVMTSRLSRYMVLMKFRDSRIAKQWRKEFDGKPYDSMEVSILPPWYSCYSGY